MYVFSLLLALLSFITEWQTHYPENCRCSIYMPSDVEIKSQEFPSELGQIVINNFAFAEEDGAKNVYMLNHTIYPDVLIEQDSTEFIDEFLLASLEESKLRLNANVDYSSSYSIKEGRGLKFRMRYNEEGTVNKGFYIYRDKSLYLVQVFTSSDKALNDDMELFLNSFKLLED